MCLVAVKSCYPGISSKFLSTINKIYYPIKIYHRINSKNFLVLRWEKEGLQTGLKSAKLELDSRNRLLKDLMSLRVSPNGTSQARQGASEQRFLQY